MTSRYLNYGWGNIHLDDRFRDIMRAIFFLMFEYYNLRLLQRPINAKRQIGDPQPVYQHNLLFV